MRLEFAHGFSIESRMMGALKSSAAHPKEVSLGLIAHF